MPYSLATEALPFSLALCASVSETSYLRAIVASLGRD